MAAYGRGVGGDLPYLMLYFFSSFHRLSIQPSLQVQCIVYRLTARQQRRCRYKRYLETDHNCNRIHEFKA